MAKKKVSPRLSETHYRMLCAIADYQESSLTSAAEQGLVRWLEAEYRNAHPILRARFDAQLGIALAPEGQSTGRTGISEAIRMRKPENSPL